MASSIQIYTAESRVRHLPQVLWAMVRGLVDSPYVAFRLAQRDIKSQYARSAFGMLWDFIDPLVLATAFYFLRQANVFSTGDIPMPYAIYVIFGLLMYQTFVDATMLCVDIMNRFRGLITQQKIAPEALILSVFFRVAFFSVFRLAVMLIFALLTDALSPIGFVKFVLLFPVLILSGMAIGILLAPFNTIYQDVGRLVRTVLVPLRFISPAIFVLPQTRVFDMINTINPLASLLNNLRLLATANTTSDPTLALTHCAVLLVIGLLGWFLFHVCLPVLSERL